MKRLIAEFFGTFWLVFGGCGAAVIAGSDIGNVGIALAFGLTVLTMCYAVGGISGGHFNPAVTLGLMSAGKFEKKDVIGYILAQLVGAILAAAILYIIVDPNTGEPGSFASNYYYEIMPAFLLEAILTFFFIFIILGSISSRVPQGFAPIAIGLTLTIIHLVSIPITNTSVNPARSTSQAIFAGTDALCQLWLFWVAPILGGILAGITYKKVIDN